MSRTIRKNELKKGIKVEAEHTKGKLFAQKKRAKTKRALQTKIAKDHLREIPDYYTRLSRMEINAKKRKR